MSETTYDWQAIVGGLSRYLKLRSIPIGMKLFETVEAMEAIPRIREHSSRAAKAPRQRCAEAITTAPSSRSRPDFSSIATVLARRAGLLCAKISSDLLTKPSFATETSSSEACVA